MVLPLLAAVARGAAVVGRGAARGTSVAGKGVSRGAETTGGEAVASTKNARLITSSARFLHHQNERWHADNDNKNSWDSLGRPANDNRNVRDSLGRPANDNVAGIQNPALEINERKETGARLLGEKKAQQTQWADKKDGGISANTQSRTSFGTSRRVSSPQSFVRGRVGRASSQEPALEKRKFPWFAFSIAVIFSGILGVLDFVSNATLLPIPPLGILLWALGVFIALIGYMYIKYKLRSISFSLQNQIIVYLVTGISLIGDSIMFLRMIPWMVFWVLVIHYLGYPTTSAQKGKSS